MLEALDVRHRRNSTFIIRYAVPSALHRKTLNRIAASLCQSLHTCCILADAVCLAIEIAPTVHWTRKTYMQHRIMKVDVENTVQLKSLEK